MTETTPYLSHPALGTPVPPSVRSFHRFREPRHHPGPARRDHPGIALRSIHGYRRRRLVR
jgi:hypothetical protein